MAESTFFANRAIAKVVTSEAEVDSSVTFAASTSITLADVGSYSAGDYVYNHTDDNQFYLSRVASYDGGTDTITLEYAYEGTTGAAKSLYKGTLTTISVMKGVEVTSNWEIETLYGLDSLERQDEAKHSIDTEIKISYAKFDPDPSADWVMSIIKPAGGDGTVSDTYDLYVPYMVITVEDTDAAVTEMILSEVYFEGLPMPMSENDFVVRELTGHAKDIKFRSY